MSLPTLAASTLLDRESQKRNDPEYLEQLLAAPGSRFMILSDHKPVIWSNADRTEGGIRWFTREQVQGFGLPIAEAYFLGVDKETRDGRFAISATDHRVRNAPGAVDQLRPIVDLRALAMEGGAPSPELSLMGLAKALAHWHDSNRCCGHCGGGTISRDGGWKRKCWACGKEHFPRTDPVVIMLIVDEAGDRALLGHEERFMENMWSTLAGFLEPGEDIAHAVRRETFEEAGIRVGEVRFHSAQPWPFPHSLMMGCHGIAETTDITIDPDEIKDARWFSKDELKLMLARTHPDGLWVPGKQAIARVLIQAFVDDGI